MAENELPHYLTGKQYTLRIGEAEKKTTAEFINTFFGYGKPPESAREYFNAIHKVALAIHKVALDLHSKQAPENSEELNRLKTENENLKQENEILKASENSKSNEIDKLLREKIAATGKSEIETTAVQPATSTLQPVTLEEVLKDPRLFSLVEVAKENKCETIADFIVCVKRDYDYTLMGLTVEPLRLLEDAEYTALKKWDDEIFLPAMEALLTQELKEKYQIEDIKKELTARHKFMMFWAFVIYDPAEKLEAMIPNLTEAQKASLQDMRFPLQSHFEQVLLDIQLKKTTRVNYDTTEHFPTEETATTENGRVIELNPANRTEPAEIAPGADGPE